LPALDEAGARTLPALRPREVGPVLTSDEKSGGAALGPASRPREAGPVLTSDEKSGGAALGPASRPREAGPVLTPRRPVEVVLGGPNILAQMVPEAAQQPTTTQVAQYSEAALLSTLRARWNHACTYSSLHSTPPPSSTPIHLATQRPRAPYTQRHHLAIHTRSQCAMLRVICTRARARPSFTACHPFFHPNPYFPHCCLRYAASRYLTHNSPPIQHVRGTHGVCHTADGKYHAVPCFSTGGTPSPRIFLPSYHVHSLSTPQIFSSGVLTWPSAVATPALSTSAPNVNGSRIQAT